MKEMILFVLKLGIGFFLFQYLLQEEISQVFSFKIGLQPFFILLSLQLIATLISSFRWRFILFKVFHYKMSTLQAFQIIWTGNFFSLIALPYVSNDITRVFYIKKTEIDFKNGLRSIFFDRFSVFIAFSLMGFISLVCMKYTLPLNIWVVSFIISSLLVTFLFPLGMNFFRHTLLVYTLSSVSVLLRYFALLYCLSLFGHTTGSNSFYSVGSSLLTELIPITPGNMGIGHFSLEYLLEQIKISNGAEIYQPFFLSKIVFCLLGVFPWFFMKGKTRAS